MTTTPKVLIAMQAVPNATTLAYTSPISGKGTWVDQFDVTSYDAASNTVRVWVVPSGGSAVDTTLRVNDKSVASKASLSLDEVVGSFLNPGDSLHWSCSAANKVNGGASGREIT